MEVADYTLASEELERDFDVSVYGNGGFPVIVFPESDSTCTSWENHGMTDALADLIDGGKVQLYCIDSMDDEGWYARSALPEYRLENIRAYLAFAQNDFLSFVLQHTSSEEKPLVAGAGMGALNATLLVLNDPAQFSGLLALSGNYDVRGFLDDEPSEDWLSVSPVDRVAGLTGDEADQLRGLRLCFVCGQDGSEDGITTQRALDAEFEQKGIDATFEYWGYDVTHDWGWWQQEAQQMLPCLLTPSGLRERRLSAELAAAKAEADQAAAQLTSDADQLEQAQSAQTAAKRRKREANKRLKHERSQVADHTAREQQLSQVAQDAWAKRDEVARKLDEATRAGNVAQAAADDARAQREKAEWIAGEAQAEAQRSDAEAKDAALHVKERAAAVADATAAKERADEAYAKAKQAFDDEKAAAAE